MINVKINGRVFYKLLLVRGSELIPSEGNHVLALIQIIPTCSCENCMRFDYNLGFILSWRNGPHVRGVIGKFAILINCLLWLAHLLTISLNLDQFNWLHINKEMPFNFFYHKIIKFSIHIIAGPRCRGVCVTPDVASLAALGGSPNSGFL